MIQIILGIFLGASTHKKCPKYRTVGRKFNLDRRTVKNI